MVTYLVSKVSGPQPRRLPSEMLVLSRSVLGRRFRHAFNAPVKGKREVVHQGGREDVRLADRVVPRVANVAAGEIGPSQYRPPRRQYP